jgi:hypothetical protein
MSNKAMRETLRAFEAWELEPDAPLQTKTSSQARWITVVVTKWSPGSEYRVHPFPNMKAPNLEELRSLVGSAVQDRESGDVRLVVGAEGSPKKVAILQSVGGISPNELFDNYTLYPSGEACGVTIPILEDKCPLEGAGSFLKKEKAT